MRRVLETSQAEHSELVELHTGAEKAMANVGRASYAIQHAKNEHNRVLGLALEANKKLHDRVALAVSAHGVKDKMEVLNVSWDPESKTITVVSPDAPAQVVPLKSKRKA